jgi:hypothetical protein
MIEVTLAMLADAANLSNDGKLNVLGEFNLLLADEPPWAVVGRSLVVRFEGHAGDIGMHTAALRLLDEDRNLVWATADAQIEFPPAKLPGIRARAVMIVPLPPFALMAEGTYELEVFVDGAQRGRTELHCVLRRDMPGDAGR